MRDNLVGLQRLRAQGLIGGDHASPLAALQSLGAVQAQDYGQSLWAVGARTANATAESVEQAVRDRQILRTWTMRGTIHFVPARDAGWIVALCATRQIRAAALRHKQLELDTETFERSSAIFREHLLSPMSRPDIFALLQRHGIPTDGQRGYHIIVQHAQSGLIALGPMAGKQPTAVLLDAWIRDPVRMSLDDALVEFARRYFVSHGPATIRDFAWWAGLTLTEARRAHDAIRTSLVECASDGDSYWAHESCLEPASSEPRDTLFLLPAFDEFLLGYQDRSAVLSVANAPLVAPSANGLFKPTIVEDGVVTGTWSRTVRAKGVAIELSFFSQRRRRAKARIDAACERYAQFLGMPVVSRVEV